MGFISHRRGRIYVTGPVKGGDVGLQAKVLRMIAIVSGIGMVHQHFMLVENLTVAENIALSLGQLRRGIVGNPSENGVYEKALGKFRFKREDAIHITEALSEQFGLTVDPRALVRTLSVGLKQRVEILKALAV